MKIIEQFPPNIKEIRERFELSGKEIFTYGKNVYNPNGTELSEPLKAHEMIHMKQQGRNPRKWWDKYFDDVVFRFDQELEAHIKEYQVYCQLTPSDSHKRVYLAFIAVRLSSKMYGNMCTATEAKKAILYG